MKQAVRIKLYQNLVNYRLEGSYGYVQSYPLPTPSMVKGMVHSILELNEFENLAISIQGFFDSVVTNLQRVYKFDRFRKENEDKLPVLKTTKKLMLNRGIIYVDEIVNMNLILHICFDNEYLTEKLAKVMKKRTIILGRNEDIANVDYNESGLVNLKVNENDMLLKNNIYLTPEICKEYDIIGSYYHLPFYYEPVKTFKDKRIFKRVRAVYVAKNTLLEIGDCKDIYLDELNNPICFLRITDENSR